MKKKQQKLVKIVYIDPCFEMHPGDLSGPVIVSCVGFLCEDPRFPKHVSIAQEFSDVGPVAITHVPQSAVLHRKELYV